MDPSNITLKIEKGAESTDNDVIARLSEFGDTWPKIFLNGKFIGGYSNLEATCKKINNGSI
jgi:glutaredoxin